jgi:hypothetical protein
MLYSVLQRNIPLNQCSSITKAIINVQLETAASAQRCIRDVASIAIWHHGAPHARYFDTRRRHGRIVVCFGHRLFGHAKKTPRQWGNRQTTGQLLGKIPIREDPALVLPDLERRRP